MISPDEQGWVISPGEQKEVINTGEQGGMVSPGEQGGVISPGVEGNTISPHKQGSTVSPGEPKLRFAQDWHRKMNLATQEHIYFGCKQYRQAIVLFHLGVPALES